MSLLAGFDFVAEVTNEVIRRLIKTNLQIGGVPANPPFELTLPLGGGAGSAHLIVTDLVLDLNANDTITLSLPFAQGSVMLTSPLALTVCPLDGTITITAPLRLVDAGNAIQQIAVGLDAATVVIAWSAASNQELANDLAATPVTPAQFSAAATDAFTNYVRLAAAPSLPIGFRVVPGTNGSISPALQFERLEVHCIPAPDRQQQALGIFGILLVDHHANGDHTQKGNTAITASTGGVCISIAPDAFHTLIFCPSIARSMKTDLAHLPATCGPAGGFSAQGVTINSLSDHFTNGHIDINGSVSKSGTCYDAHGTFHGVLTLSMSGTQLVPQIKMDEPDIDVDIPWYCYLAAAVVFGAIGIAIAAVADAVADVVASSIGGSALQSALGTGIPGIGASGLAGASFSSVSISPEGLTMQGKLPVFTPSSQFWPALSLTGSVLVANRQELSSGLFYTKLWCMPEAKMYPYVEYAQRQSAVYTLSGTLTPQPLVPQFSVQHLGVTTALTGAQGTITLPAMATHYPMPLATGGTALTQAVHIDYTITGMTIQLTNIPEEGNYNFYLDAAALDCTGAPVLRTDGQPLETWAHIQFEGNHVEIGGGYAQDVQKCADLLAKRVKELSERYAEYQDVPIWVQVNYPPEEVLVTYIRNIIASGLPETDEVLLASKLAHGNSFYRALFSRAATEPAMLRMNADRVRSQEQLTTVASELVRLSHSLTALNIMPEADEQRGGG
jgi:hypothetical protein